MDRGDDEKYVKWSKAVKIEGNFKCSICEATNVYFESHHLNSWNAYPEQRYILSNGRNLCRDCHHRFHQLYGKGNNTEFQYNEYVEIFKTLLKIAKNISIK